MAVLVTKSNGHLQNQLTKSLEKILEEANQSGELKLSNRKLKDFPKTSEKFNLSDTVIADLSKNRFSELPEEVTEFYFLEKLQCYHNSIRYIPDSVSGLQCLRFLDLSRNQLSALPRELCQLPIQILLVSNNSLTSLPDELNRMANLTELDASSNQLTHLPPRMSELKCLQSLILRNNLLLAIPIELTFLKLIRLDIRANRIGVLPIEMRDMDTLIELLVDDNPLTSPPASLCRRGKVHIFKYLEIKAISLDKKIGVNCGGGGGTLGRNRTRKSGTCSPLGPPLLVERLKQKRQNVDSGYSTCSDGYNDKRWSQEIIDVEKHWSSAPISASSATELNGVGGTHSTLSTPSTVSPAPLENALLLDDDLSKASSNYDNSIHQNTDQTHTISNGNAIMEEKSNSFKPLNQIQTYREYKEALKQQRAHDVPSIYRIKDTEQLLDQSYYLNKTEPNTPTHLSPLITRNSLATSKSDPTPLNSVLLSSPKHNNILIDDNNKQQQQPKKNFQQQKYLTTTTIFRHNNSNIIDNNNKILTKNLQDYIKPNSPTIKCDNNSSSNNSQLIKQTTTTITNLNRNTNNYINGGSTIITNNSTKNLNGIRTTNNRNISWNKKELPTENKMTFTMRREIDKAREETDLINQLRNIIELRLKMTLPEDLAPALTDGVVLCHLANHIKPRSVASIHVPSPAVPKLTMARCRRNVDNFIEACRKIGVDENLLCCAADVLEGRGLVQIAITVTELLRFHLPRSPLHTNSTTSTVV